MTLEILDGARDPQLVAMPWQQRGPRNHSHQVALMLEIDGNGGLVLEEQEAGAQASPLHWLAETHCRFETRGDAHGAVRRDDLEHLRAGDLHCRVLVDAPIWGRRHHGQGDLVTVGRIGDVDHLSLWRQRQRQHIAALGVRELNPRDTRAGDDGTDEGLNAIDIGDHAAQVADRLVELDEEVETALAHAGPREIRRSDGGGGPHPSFGL